MQNCRQHVKLLLRVGSNGNIYNGCRSYVGKIHCYGDLDELQYADNLKIPQIRSSNECLVRISTTSVNPIDVAMLNGYGSKVLNALRGSSSEIEFPLILGREFCGTLLQCGMEVRPELTLGKRVWGVVPLHLNGAHAEYVAVPDYCLALAPAELKDDEAAAVLYAGLTAWSGLYITGGLGGISGAMCGAGGGASKRVLVLGGSGSVGSLAIQMLKAEQTQVVATCNSDAIELVRNMGADHVIAYNNAEEISKLADYGRFDIVLDCAGQGMQYADTLNCNFQQYITFSSPLMRNIDKSGMGLGLLRNLADLVETNARTLSNHCGLVKWGFFVPAPQGIDFLGKLVQRNKLLPTIEQSYRFEHMPEAYKRVQSGHLRGKVIVNLN